MRAGLAAALLSFGLAVPRENSDNPKNLRLSDIPTRILPVLQKHNIPVKKPAFARFLQNLRTLHDTRMEEGFFDMAGDYFMTSQNEETRIYLGLKYAYPNKSLGDQKLTNVSSTEKMVDDFVAAIERDADPDRKSMLNGYIDSIADREKVDRKEAAGRMVDSIFRRSWLYQPFTPDLVQETGDLDSSYAFFNRGLRTTADFRLGLTFHDFISSDEGRKALPGSIRKVLILGPGLEFINLLVGNVCPEQIFEPFGIMDSLINTGKSEISNLQVDAFDINERVVNHLKTAIQSGKPYELYKIAGQPFLEDDPAFKKYFSDYGDSLPGIQYLDAPRHWKPITPYALAVHHISIPADVVRKIHPLWGDITTTSLEENQYDLIVSFDTLIYLNETEHVLAGINLWRALKNEGVFITDNRFESDTGRRVGRKASRPSQPLFDDAFLKLSVPKKVRGKEVFVYRRGSR